MLGEIKLWYRQPADSITLIKDYEIPSNATAFADASTDFRFASSVALLGMLLRKSNYKGTGNAAMVTGIAKKSLGADKGGYRKEFLKLVKELKKTGNVK